jgi:hypothetical protein
MSEPQSPATSNKALLPGENAVFVLGILSVVFALVFLWAGLILGIIGVVKGRKLLNYARANNLPQPTTGYTGYLCSLVGLTLSIVFLTVACIFMVILVLYFAILCGDAIHSSSGANIQGLIQGIVLGISAVVGMNKVA